jgi:hypothetical protein
MIKNVENRSFVSNFWFGYTILLILTSGIAILFTYVKPEYLSSHFWTIQGFFGVISILSHVIANLGLKSREEFHTYYLGSMAVRFIFSLFFILFSMVYLSGNKITYVANFFILYILYASFEIYHLLRNLRADSKRNGNEN